MILPLFPVKVFDDALSRMYVIRYDVFSYLNQEVPLSEPDHLRMKWPFNEVDNDTRVPITTTLHCAQPAADLAYCSPTKYPRPGSP